MTIPVEVAKLHNFFSDNGQEEDEDCRFLAANNHPDAAKYCRLRSLFDSLSYACNAYTRLISYRDKNNRAEYGAPVLIVGYNQPQYPRGTQAYKDLLVKHAVNGFSDIGSSIFPGVIVINTADRNMISAIQRINYEYEDYRFVNAGEITIHPRKAAHVEALFSVIERFHKDFLLPRGQFQSPADRPMAKKQFLLASVDNRPSSEGADGLEEEQAPLMRCARQVLDCIENGFDPDQSARQWLGRLMTDANHQIEEALRRRRTPGTADGMRM